MRTNSTELTGREHTENEKPPFDEIITREDASDTVSSANGRKLDGPPTKGNSKSRAEPQALQSNKPLTWPARIFIFAVLLLLLTFDFVFRTAAALAATLVAVIPMAIAAFIIVRLSDHTLPKSFVVEQAFWGAAPGYLFALMAQAMLILSLIWAFFPVEMRRIMEAAQKVNTNAPKTNYFAVEMSSVPLWKLLAFVLVLAFAVVTVYQLVTLTIGQRTRELMSGGERDVDLSAYSMAGGVAAGALGFAGVHQFVITFNTVTVLMTKKVNIITTMSSLSLTVLELSVQLATALMIGSAMARKYVMREKVSVFLWFIIAVLLHGTLYAVVLCWAVLKFRHIVPWWTFFILPATEIVVFIILGVLVKKSYKCLRKSNYELVESGSNP